VTLYSCLFVVIVCYSVVSLDDSPKLSRFPEKLKAIRLTVCSVQNVPSRLWKQKLLVEMLVYVNFVGNDFVMSLTTNRSFCGHL
jgi:hypothetical protein